jgi:ferredoxin
MGALQDMVARIGRRGRKLPYTFSPAKSWLRYSVLVLFIAAIIVGVNIIVALLDPYGAFGRMANNLVLPIWQWGNNLLALMAERLDSYAFYTTDVWMKSLATLIVAVVTFVIVAILAWRNGRTYCNTICPVGTFLGLISRFSLFQIRVDEQKCKKCTLCARNCKAACIDSKEGKIDNSRCVACMNCISKCNNKAIGYRFGILNNGEKGEIGEKGEKVVREVRGVRGENIEGRKAFLATSVALATAGLKAQIIPKATDIKLDGGLADLLDKQSPVRQTPLTPAGSSSDRNMKRKCTACQLCVSVCPTGVLRPSTSLDTFMQPVMSFERGYCRPECVKCSEVCPTGAILAITKEEKSSTQIGHAVWMHGRCVPLRDNQECDNCERHCPTKAISMIPSVPGNENSLKIPAVNEALCIGCGACEYLCPARPLSAIYVEGHQVHKII